MEQGQGIRRGAASLSARLAQAARLARNADYALVVDSRQLAERIDLAALAGVKAPLRSPNVFEYGDLPTSPAADLDFADLARRSADIATAEISQLANGLFASLVPAADLSAAYRAWLTYKLQGEIPKLACLAGAPRVNYRRKLVVQTAVPLEIARELAERHIRPRSSQPLLTFSGVEARNLDNLSAITERWVAKETITRKKKFSDGIAFLVGTPNEAEWIAALVERIPTAVPINILLKAKDPDLGEPFHKRWPERRVSVGSWRGMANDCLTPAEHARVTAAFQALQERLSEPHSERLRDHGQWLVAFFITAVGAIGLRRGLRPRLIVGSMEKSRPGLVLSALGPYLGMKTFNIQHGNIGRQRMLDLVAFDMFGIWREETRRILLEDGYNSEAAVRVVGRPAASRQSALDGDLQPDPKLTEWIAGRRVLTLFLQPPKAPYVSPARLSELLDLLTRFVGAGERDVLLVKPHPANTPEDIKRWSGTIQGNGAVRMLAGQQNAMATALAATDIAVSLSSTALQDAVVAGRRAIAYDPDAALDRLRMDLPGGVEVARSARDLSALLERSGRRRTPDQTGKNFLDTTMEIIKGLHGAWPEPAATTSAN